MPAGQESSVLFALNELRVDEHARARQQATRSRELAALAREQAEAAARARAVARENADELLVLRAGREEAAALNMAMAQDLAVAAALNQALELRLRQLELAAPIPLPGLPAPSGFVHFAWALGLLLSCLGVFVLSYQPSTPESVVDQALVIAETRDCPGPSEPLDPVPAAEPALVEPTEAQPRPRPAKPVERPQAPRETGLNTLVDPNCDGPLCGLPE